MALKQTFVFEVNGVKEATTDVNKLSDSVDNLTDSTEKLGDTSKKVAEDLDEVTAVERAESIKRVVDGLAGGITTVAASLRGLGIESEALNTLEQRANEFVAAVDGAVRVVSVFDKQNIKAFKAAIDGFKKSGIAARLFGSATRTAIAATGIGLLVIALGTAIANFDKLKEVATRNFDAIKRGLFAVFPPLGVLVDNVDKFAERVGGFRQLFRGVTQAARAFFENIGAGFAALIKGDFGRLREVIKDFGKDSSEAFNEGVQEVNEQIAQETADALTQSTIEANKRRLALVKARGQDTFALEKQILQQELSLLESGSAEALDKIAEIEALKAARVKERADRNAEIRKKEAEAEKAAADEAAAIAEAEAEKAVEIAERRAEALFELEQLRIQNQIDALDSLDELTADQLEQRAELLADLRQNELDRALENEELTGEEILLLNEQFAADFIEIQREKNDQLRQLNEKRAADEKEADDKITAEKKKAEEDRIKDKEAAAAAELELRATLNTAAIEGLEVIKNVVGEESKLGKAAIAAQKIFALADIGIKLQQELAANAAAAAANPTNAVTFGAAGVTQLTASNILSIVRAAASTAAVIRLKRGGVVQGASHANGGVRGTGRFNNIEVEGGEFVVNKNSTRKFLPALQKINRMQNGGQLPNFDSINSAIGVTQEQTGEFIEAVQRLADREVVVSVEEINRVNGNLTRVKERATI